MNRVQKIISYLMIFISSDIGAMSIAAMPVSSSPTMRCMALTPACMGDTSSTRPSDFCVQCQYLDQSVYPTFRSPVSPYYPWWYNYGMYQYPNIGYPGYWNNGGLSNYHYVGNGNMVAGKPNIYLHGLKENEEVVFKINYLKDANELATAPIHSQEGWQARYQKNKLVIDQTSYDYLYYDYKLDSKNLQSENGFCGDQAEVYGKMVSILNLLKFKEKEVDDFENYWAFKIPKGDFCVFPQEHEQLQSLAQWNSSKQPQYFKRVLFVLIPKDQIVAKMSANFNSLPKNDWNPGRAVYRNTAQTAENFQVHEWGLAFLTK